MTGFFTAVLACAVAFSACGNSYSKPSYTSGTQYAAEESAPGYDADFYTEDVEAEEAYALETAEDTDTGKLVAGEQSDKLVYSGSLRLQTLEYDSTMDSIHKKINEAGGFIQYEDESDSNYNWYYNNTSSMSTRNAEIHIRVPSESFDPFMKSLEEDGQVMNRHVNVDNISQTYYDTEASVKAYEIEQERLLEMMDKARTIEDMIAVEARLSEVERELNMYRTDLASMDRDVEYSTVHVSVEEVREYTEQKDDSTFGSRLKETVKDSWKGFLSFMEGLLHLIIRLIPFIILIGVIVLIVRALDKKFGGKLRDKRAARHQERMMKKQARQQAKHERKMRKAGAVPPAQQTPPQQGPQGQQMYTAPQQGQQMYVPPQQGLGPQNTAGSTADNNKADN